MKFWDSSALVPIVSREAATPRCVKFLGRDPALYVCTLTPVEINSALLRKRRAGEIRPLDLRDARKRLAELGRSWSTIQMDEAVIARAIRVMEIHDLRTGDAVQLASALAACGDRPARLPFVALDEKLLLAAEREGFAVVAP